MGGIDYYAACFFNQLAQRLKEYMLQNSLKVKGASCSSEPFIVLSHDDMQCIL